MLHRKQAVWGGLTCHVVGRSASPTLGVVLCHGFGAPGTDLVPLGEELLRHDERLARAVQFVFPEAPLSLKDWGYPQGRAWWHLDLERFQRLLAAGELSEVRNTCPAELPAARQALLALVDEWSVSTGLPAERCVLGGFSQGGMLSIDVALHAPMSPAGLAVLSGSLINEREWRSRAAARAGLPVFQSHGQYDCILPFVTGTWVRDLLRSAGCEVEFVEFPGGHEIPWSVLSRLAEFLARGAAAE